MKSPASARVSGCRRNQSQATLARKPGTRASTTSAGVQALAPRPRPSPMRTRVNAAATAIIGKTTLRYRLMGTVLAMNAKNRSQETDEQQTAPPI